MKLNKGQTNKLAEIIAIFIINVVIFLLSKFFIEISYRECFLYSAINSMWMPFILLPAITKTLNSLKKKKNHPHLNHSITI